MVTKDELFKMIQENNVRGIKAFTQLLALYRKLDRKQQIADGEELINSHNADGQTPVYIAALSDHAEMLREFLNANANPNKKNTDGLAPLHVAAYFGCLDAVKILIEEAKCDIDIEKTDTGETALYLAAQQNQREVMFYLISKGADVTKANSEKRTPLHIAAQKGHFDICRMLLATNRANPTEKDHKGVTPTHLAAYLGYVDILKIFIEEEKVDVDIITEGDNETPLYFASQQNQIAAASYLINQGANVNKPRLDGQTPFFAAAQDGHKDIIQLLLATKKINVNQKRGDNATALILSSVKNQLDACKLLLENNADLYAIDDNGNMAIHYAASYGNSTIFDFFVNEGHVDPNIRNRHGVTPLMFAASYGRTNAVKEIAKHLRSIDLNTAVQKDGINATAVYLAVQNNHPETLQELVNLKCNVNVPFLNGKPPIYKAVSNGHLDVVKILIAAGARYDLNDLVQYSENPEITKILNNPIIAFEESFKNLSITHVLRNTINAPVRSAANNDSNNNNTINDLPKSLGQK